MATVRLEADGVSASCPECGVVSFFAPQEGGAKFGALVRNESAGAQTLFELVKCGNCKRGSLLVKRRPSQNHPFELRGFFPNALTRLPLPSETPEGVTKEFREAESCASIHAFRAASAMLRSALEKVLKANGYTKGVLAKKIDEASDDGVITAARKQKAHDDVRVLGNEVVHDEWRAVDAEEVDAALHYTQRVIEDLYDDRPSVEAVLRMKKRIT